MSPAGAGVGVAVGVGVGLGLGVGLALGLGVGLALGLGVGLGLGSVEALAKLGDTPINANNRSAAESTRSEGFALLKRHIHTTVSDDQDFG